MRVFLVLLVALCLSACVPNKQVVVSIDALARPNVPTRLGSVFIVPGQDSVSSTDLQFQEYANWLGRGLQQAGFQLAASRETADIILFFDYGISDRRVEEYTYQEPIYQQNGVSSTTTTQTTRNPDNTETTTSVTTNDPVYDIVGYETKKGMRTYFDRFSDLWAFDSELAPHFDDRNLLWHTHITSKGYSDDLRDILAYMLTAAVPYLGKSSGKVVDITLRGEDRSVKVIRGDAKAR